MATTQIIRLCQNIGVVYQQALALWISWYTDPTKTITFQVGSQSGNRRLRMQYQIGADVWQYDLVALDISQSMVFGPVAYPFTLNGWRAQPPILLDINAGIDTVASFTTVMLGVRNLIYQTWFGTSSVAYTAASSAWAHAGVTTHYMQRLVGQLQNFKILDVVTLTVKTAAVTSEIVGDVAPSDLVMATPQINLQGGGGSTDIEPLTQAVQDLAHQQNVATLNNGAVQVILNSGEIIEP